MARPYGRFGARREGRNQDALSVAQIGHYVEATDIAYMSASELALKIRRRELSPVEVMDATIARIEQRNPEPQCADLLDFDGARRRGDTQGRGRGDAGRRRSGRCTACPRRSRTCSTSSPAGRRPSAACARSRTISRSSTAPSPSGSRRPAPSSSARPMRRSWACAAPATTICSARPATRSTRRCNSGGSSGGSAAAVADGLLPIAEGTDAGGSIRIPAAWCGVYGYKASYGRIPVVIRPNAFAGDLPFVFEGPITRTVEDAALAMSVLAGYDPRDPLQSRREGRLSSPRRRRPIKGMRIAYSPDFDVFPVDPRIAAVVAKAVRAFEEAGAHVEEVKSASSAAARTERCLVTPDDAAQPRHLRGHEGCRASIFSGTIATIFRRNICAGSTIGQKMTIDGPDARPGDAQRGL